MAAYGSATYGIDVYGSGYGSAVYGTATYGGAAGAAVTVPLTWHGYTPVVCVPAWGLTQIEYGIPVQVPPEVADDMTRGGASTQWKSGG